MIAVDSVTTAAHAAASSPTPTPAGALAPRRFIDAFPMSRLPIESSTPTTVVMGGREFLAFSGCNYLGLSHDPRVLAAVTRGLQRFGISTGASRETTGNVVEHEALERDLAAFTGFESGILTPEGFTANIALAQGLAAIGVRCAVIDEKSHRSVSQAAIAAGLELRTYAHLDAADAARVARAAARSPDASDVVLWTDGVFAAAGAVAPVPGLIAALPGKASRLIVDDSHGFCTLGASGSGCIEHFGVASHRPRLLLTTTLAKGLGCYGGVVLGPADVIAAVRDNAGVYRGTSPLAPPLACAAREALRVLREEPALVTSLHANTAALRARLAAAGIEGAPTPAPIFAFTLTGDRHDRHDQPDMPEIHRALLDRGILAPLIAYPGGPGATYFRVSINARHTPHDIERLGAALAETTRAPR
jgi:8-amino-7-oxononanoate synthase